MNVNEVGYCRFLVIAGFDSIQPPTKIPFAYLRFSCFPVRLVMPLLPCRSEGCCTATRAARHFVLNSLDATYYGHGRGDSGVAHENVHHVFPVGWRYLAARCVLQHLVRRHAIIRGFFDFWNSYTGRWSSCLPE